ncbi:glycosyltransferase family 31 protein [Plenodomus tracheiphilus IPT5]|uniref:Glycosyltransferase family 31 protein n=1 Tax=Plenodomus tracheiphilus IPT5 TaxID=1408161 RepID=A0A6A7BID1_9PLEO|nr:glycosyltransferase family 31 protein [Plenodomus tracheiphilus IPT5]
MLKDARDPRVTTDLAAGTLDKYKQLHILEKLIAMQRIQTKTGVIWWTPTHTWEKPATLPFGPRHCCQPIVTMHHMQPNEMNQLANFELARNKTHQPLILSERYNRFIKDILPDTLEQWDDVSHHASIRTNTYEEGKKACEDNESYFQFT